MRGSFTVIAGFAASLLAAQSRPVDASTGPESASRPVEGAQRSSLIEGRVVDDADGAPIIGATITLAVDVDHDAAFDLAEKLKREDPTWTPPKRTTRSKESDADGRFSFFARLPVEFYELRACAPGFALGPSVAASFEFPSVVRLRREGRLRGRLVSQTTGRPIRDFFLEIQSDVGSLRSAAPDSEVPTGSFDFTALGDTYIRARAEGYAPTVFGPFYVKAGTTVEGVELRIEDGAVLRGVVIDESGRPVPDARVRLAPPPPRGCSFHPSAIGWFSARTTTDARGLFDVDHVQTDASYELDVQKDGLPEVRTALGPIPKAARDCSPPAIVLRRGGRVRVKFSQHQAALIRPTSTLTELERVGANAWLRKDAPDAVLRPGEYEVRPAAPPGAAPDELIRYFWIAERSSRILTLKAGDDVVIDM